MSFSPNANTILAPLAGEDYSARPQYLSDQTEAAAFRVLQRSANRRHRRAAEGKPAEYQLLRGSGASRCGGGAHCRLCERFLPGRQCGQTCIPAFDLAVGIDRI